MPKPKVRHYPTKGFLVSSMGDVRFVRDENNRDQDLHAARCQPAAPAGAGGYRRRDFRLGGGV